MTLNNFIPSTSVRNADFVIRIGYGADENSVSIEIKAEQARGGREVLAGADWSGKVSLDLDKKIQSLVRSRIVPALPAFMEESRRNTQKAADEGEEWAVAALATAAGDMESAEEEDAAPEEDSVNRSGWSVEILGGILVPLSETATYAKTGYGGKLNLGYAFDLGAVFLTPRLILGGIFLPTNSVPKTDVMILPAGAELKLASGSNTALSPFLRLGGGMSWLWIFPSGESAQGKFVPFAEVGAGTDIWFSPSVGMTVDLGFSAYFEGSVVIWGMTPTLGLALRF